MFTAATKKPSPRAPGRVGGCLRRGIGHRRRTPLRRGPARRGLDACRLRRAARPSGRDRARTRRTTSPAAWTRRASRRPCTTARDRGPRLRLADRAARRPGTSSTPTAERPGRSGRQSNQLDVRIAGSPSGLLGGATHPTPGAGRLTATIWHPLRRVAGRVRLLPSDGDAGRRRSGEGPARSRNVRTLGRRATRSHRCGPSCSPTSPRRSASSRRSRATGPASCSRASSAPSAGGGIRSSPAIPPRSSSLDRRRASGISTRPTGCRSRCPNGPGTRGPISSRSPRRSRAPRVADLPSLTGGLMGFLSYEAAALLDGQPVPGAATRSGPPIALLVIDRAVVFDHWRQRLLLVAHVAPGRLRRGRRRRSRTWPTRLSAPDTPSPDPSPASRGRRRRVGEPNMPDDRYREIVRTMKDHISAGDIYQGVPSRRVAFPCTGGGFPVYRRLRVTNPAPYMFFVRMLGLELAGSSPEPLVRVEGRTRHDAARSPARGRAARPSSATACTSTSCSPTRRSAPSTRCSSTSPATTSAASAPRGPSARRELMSVERFSKVMHIVSTVEGELAEGAHPLDALAVTFPAGTVTGAPEAPGDGADRRARADRARAVRGRGRLLHVRGRPRLLHHDPHGGRRRRHGVRADGCGDRRRLRPRGRARRDQGEGRAPCCPRSWTRDGLGSGEEP